MGRHALKPYEVERISTTPHPDTPGWIRARARYRREEGGPLFDMHGKGKTEAAATRALKQNLAARQADTTEVVIRSPRRGGREGRSRVARGEAAPARTAGRTHP